MHATRPTTVCWMRDDREIWISILKITFRMNSIWGSFFSSIYFIVSMQLTSETRTIEMDLFIFIECDAALNVSNASNASIKDLKNVWKEKKRRQTNLSDLFELLFKTPTVILLWWIWCFAWRWRIRFWIALAKRNKTSKRLNRLKKRIEICRSNRLHKFPLNYFDNYHLLCVAHLAVWMRNCLVSTTKVTMIHFDFDLHLYFHFVASEMMNFVEHSSHAMNATRSLDPWDRLASSIFQAHRSVVANSVDLVRPWNCLTCSMHGLDRMRHDDWERQRNEWKALIFYLKFRWIDERKLLIWKRISLTQYLCCLNYASDCEHNRLLYHFHCCVHSH